MSTTDDPIEKPSGGDVRGSGPASLDDLVDEASLESFPCSDAPTFTSLHVGTPVTTGVSILMREDGQRDEQRVEDADDEAARETRVRALAGAQGLFFVATGLWPVIHVRSFEAVTGRSHRAPRPPSGPDASAWLRGALHQHR